MPIAARDRTSGPARTCSVATKPRRCSPRSVSPDRRATTAGTLSYGNQKQLELGIALASDPKILLLDEPTAGMSASETHETIALIERIARERRLTLLFTEHDMAVVFSIAQRIAVMHQGRVIAHGDPDAVRADARGPSRLSRRPADGSAIMSALLELEDVHAAYGLSRVLFGISLEVNEGECVCLLGRNGVGKTTTMRSVMGLTPPSAGHVRFKSRDITGWSPYRVARAGIGFVPEDRRIFAELSVWENLDVARRAAARPGRWTIEAVIELFPVLGKLRDRQGGFLSGGEQQMLTIARTLMGNPELLLLDEPSEGLAPLVVEALLAKVGELKAQGLTILLAEQGIEFSLALADRVYVLEKGAVRFSGSAAALRSDRSALDQMLAL